MAGDPWEGRRIGRYEIVSRLGAGGMGTVYVARDTHVQRDVAVKVINPHYAGNPEIVARFERETEILARLDSAHIVAILDHGVADDVPYLVTQLVRGGDLGALIDQRGPLPADQAISVVAQVAEALRDAHRGNVLHRDIKPSNVLIRDPDVRPLFAYLCDFGIAQTLSDTRLTSPGVVAGTYGYLAPERIEGGDADVASDIYALGCVLWCALTGRPPYDGSDPAVLIAHREAPVPQLPGTDARSQHLNRVLARSLAKRPEQRYSSAEAFLADLTAPPASSAPTTAAPVSRPPTGPPRRRRGLVALLAALVALAVVTVGLVVLRPWQDDPAERAKDEPSGADATSDAPPVSTGDVDFDLDGNGFGDLVAFDFDRSPDFGVNYYSDGTSLRAEPRKDPARQGGAVWGDIAPGTRGLEQVSFVYRGDSKKVLFLVTDDSGQQLSSRRTAIAPDSASGFDLVTGDFNGDDSDDVAMLYVDPAKKTRLAVLLAEGNGRLSAPQDWNTPTNAPPDASAMWAADADRDGRDDLLLGAPTDQGRTGFQVLASTGTRFDVSGDRVTEPLIDLGVSVIDDFLATGGVSDATVVIRDGKVQVRLFEYDGQRFSARGNPQVFDWEGGDLTDRESEPGVAAPRTTRADFDGDGYIDLAFAFSATAAGDEPIWVMLNRAGTFEAPEKWGVIDACETEGYCLATIDDQIA